MEYVFSMVLTVAFFASAVWIVKILVENKTRRIAIEKGLGAEDIARLFRTESTGASGLKWGLVFIAVGLGLFIGFYALPSDAQPMLTWTPSVILAGIALLVYSLLARKGRA